MKNTKIDPNLFIVSLSELTSVMKVHKRILDTLDLLKVHYLWQMFAWEQETLVNQSDCPFWEHLLRFRYVGPKGVEELQQLLRNLGLPEVGSFTFTEEELQILKSKTTEKK
ncbi:MAG: hypothetical protein WCO66_02940 [Candidatus Absconditabacteria bacterium]